MLILFFMAIATFDSVAIESANDEPILVEIQSEEETQEHTLPETLSANILK